MLDQHMVYLNVRIWINHYICSYHLRVIINAVFIFNVATYRQTANIRHSVVGNKIFDHSGVVGAAPVSAAPSTSSFSTKHMVSMDWAQTTARRDENHFSLGIWCVLYWGFYGISRAFQLKHCGSYDMCRYVWSCIRFSWLIYMRHSFRKFPRTIHFLHNLPQNIHCIWRLLLLPVCI